MKVNFLAALQHCAKVWRQLFGTSSNSTPQPSAPAATQPRRNSLFQPATTSAERYTRSPQQEKALQLLQANYDLRYNVITEEAEYRNKHEENSQWHSVDLRTFNSMTIDTIEAKIGIWGRDIDRLLHSHKMPSFHPLQNYMTQLPIWDGRDRATALAQRVSNNPLWLKGFRVWLRSLSALWMGHSTCRSNQLVPILVSERQGWHKSSFCRQLMPTALQRYYTDLFALNRNSEQCLARMGLINLDEFDRISPLQWPKLKNLIQLERLSVRRLYKQEMMSLPRTASFIGTSNEVELLSDPTGSRRFLCIRLEHDIDCSPIDHAQLFAQLKAEVLAEEPLFLTKTEERELEEHNRTFWRRSPMMEVLWQCFRLPEGQEEGVCLTAAQIFVELQKRFPAAMRQQSPSGLGRLLRGEGLRPIHTRNGSTYRLEVRD